MLLRHRRHTVECVIEKHATWYTLIANCVASSTSRRLGQDFPGKDKTRDEMIGDGQLVE